MEFAFTNTTINNISHTLTHSSVLGSVLTFDFWILHQRLEFALASILSVLHGEELGPRVALTMALLANAGLTRLARLARLLRLLGLLCETAACLIAHLEFGS